jgi:hypothetical protein
MPRNNLSAKVGNQMTKTPGEMTVELCEEVLWWHTALGGHAITMSDIKSKSPYRIAPLVAARADCMRRLRFDRGWSYPRIAAYFGMDHSTCMHHIKRRDSASKPVKNKNNLPMSDLRARSELDRYRHQKTRQARVGGNQPAGESHENP